MWGSWLEFFFKSFMDFHYYILKGIENLCIFFEKCIFVALKIEIETVQTKY